MLTSTAGVTVKEAVPEMLDEVAVMVVVPVATPVASPLEPEALETVGVAVTDEDHVALAVRSWVVKSEKCPVAVNWTVLPAATDAVVGETVMLKSTAAPAGWLVSGSTTPTATRVASNVRTRERSSRAPTRRLTPYMDP